MPADNTRYVNSTKKVRTWGATLTRKPRMPLRPHYQWDGEWELGKGGIYDGEKWVRGMMWSRNRLELDGHEDCCHHSWPVFVQVGEWVEDTEEDE